jgi:hypothetical protein
MLTGSRATRRLSGIEWWILGLQSRAVEETSMHYSAATDPDLHDWLRWTSEGGDVPNSVRAVAEAAIPRRLAELRPAESGVVGTHAAETSPLDAPKKMSAKSAAPKSLSCEGLLIRAQSSTLTYFLCCTPLL